MRLLGRPPRVVGPAEARRLARRRLPKPVFDYIDGAADDEFTVAENRRAFGDLAFAPRVLARVAERRLDVEVLGQRLALPVLTAPTGLSRVAGRGGEVAAARAAVAAGTVSILSGTTSLPIEAVAQSVQEPQWFQLYLYRDRQTSLDRIALAKRLGFRVLVVTVDAPVSGNRERDVRNGLSVPVRVRPRMALETMLRPRWLAGYLTGPPLIAHHDKDLPRGSSSRGGVAGGERLTSFVQGLFNSDMGWEDLRWIREAWGGPLVLKGVMCGEDAALAVAAGCEGVVVSNHGGRQLDGVPATIDMLPEIVEAVAGQAEVLIDGGVRRGSDVVKALALGAKACLIGRPWLYGLAAGGEAGVARVLQTFAEEIDRTLALLGVHDCSSLDPSVLRRRPGSGWERI
jgi:isopentenyl diphosphate isomerase/L-lactate dehydrogenase-like FMN-dependent dehydrogenase